MLANKIFTLRSLHFTDMKFILQEEDGMIRKVLAFQCLHEKKVIIATPKIYLRKEVV